MIRVLALLFLLLCSGALRAEAATTSGIPVDSLVARGSRSLSAGHFAEAESLGNLALVTARQAPGVDSLSLARSCTLFARILGAEGRYSDPRARDLAEQGFRITERHSGPNDKAVLDALSTYAVMVWRGGDPEAARPMFTRVYQTQLRLLGPANVEVGHTVGNLGLIEWTLGNYTAAESLIVAAKDILERAVGPRHVEVARQWHNLGAVYWAQGEYEKAHDAATRAVELREALRGPNHPETMQSLTALAEIDHERGDFRECVALYEKIISRMRANGDVDSSNLALCLNNWGAVRHEMGDDKGAEELYQEALAMRERGLGPDHPDVAQTVLNLGAIRAEQDRFDEARPYYLRAAAIDEKALGPDHPALAMVLDNLAICDDELGLFAEGDSLHRRVIAIREKSIGPDSPQMADALDKYSRAYAMKGDLGTARELQTRALRIRVKALGPGHPNVSLSLHELAAFEWREGMTDSALAHSLQAESVSRDHLRLTMQSQTEEQALQYAWSRVVGLDFILSAALASGRDADVRAAWDAVIRSRALVLDEMARRRQETAAVHDSETTRLVQALTSARKKLADLIVRGAKDEPADQYLADLTNAQKVKLGAEESLAVRSETFRRQRQSDQAGYREIESALPEGFGLVAYIRFQRVPDPGTPGGWSRRQSGDAQEPVGVDSYAAFVLPTARSEPKVVDLGAASRIDSLVARWAESIRRPTVGRAGDGTYRTVADELRRAIWDPVSGSLAGDANALVVPDANLHLVNLDALPVGASQYLVEKSPAIQYLSAERDVASPSRHRSSESRLLALGDPSFDDSGGGAALASDKAFRGSTSACGDFESLHFAPLAATREETNEICARWKRRSGAGTELLGADATEARFKREAPGSSVLHLATHGFFLGASCEQTADETRGIGRLAVTASSPAPEESENPLLRAGLALAGANRRSEAKPDEDDGILTAEEISALDLGATDWAVLSACETGVGEVQAGEGVFGLRRAFQIAGARTLIMSLWPVEDRSAREWMERLYEARWDGHASTIESVRRASLGLLEERRRRGESTHPFYWGAFVAAGDWR